MRRTLFIISLLLFNIHINGRHFLSKDPIINDNVINQINKLFLLERYKDCVDSCNYYIGHKYWGLGYKSHPYRDWKKIQGYWESNDIEDVASLLYIGCAAAYEYSLSQFDTRLILNGMDWAKSCTAIYEDYLHVKIPSELSTIKDWEKYILYAERAMVATQCGNHFLAVDRNDHWLKKQDKWFNKMSDRVSDALYKNITGKDSIFSYYPILQYKVNTFYSEYMLSNRSSKVFLKAFQDVFRKRIEAFKHMIQISQEDNNSSIQIHVALNSLVYTLCATVVENEFCKKAGPNYERFCMENLILLQDISYSLNGSNRYSQSPSYTLRDIQNSLEETDCAILNFEAPVASGHLYYKYDLGTRYKNYALIITKNQEIPDVWHRGYINDTIVNDLSKIKETYPNATRFYYVGTPRMSFIDVAGNDSSIVRLHSLSQLLQDHGSKLAESEITFIGDLNYNKIGNIASFISEKKGEDEFGQLEEDEFGQLEEDKFGQLIGSAIELAYIRTLFPNIHPICGDDATRNVVISEICRNNGIFHISTHGKLSSTNIDYALNELVLKKNVMDNSCLILSGYNDTPESSLCYMSGSDVLKIKRINSEVVFLDACSSGKGAVGVSGSVGIAEAFHLIGAKNVICYLEPVDDKKATEFSNRFYLELSKGASCHDAYFRAKKSINQKLKVILWE